METVAPEEVWEVGRGLILEDLISHEKEFGFSKWNEKLLKDFKQESDTIWFTFLKDHTVIFPYSCEKNRMEGNEREQERTSRETR